MTQDASAATCATRHVSEEEKERPVANAGEACRRHAHQQEHTAGGAPEARTAGVQQERRRRRSVPEAQEEHAGSMSRSAAGACRRHEQECNSSMPEA